MSSQYTSQISQLNLISPANCSPNLTSGGRADRRSSLNGRRCLWLSSPSQRRGSAYCTLHSSPSPQRACRGGEGDQQAFNLDAHMDTFQIASAGRRKRWDKGFLCLTDAAHAAFQNNHLKVGTWTFVSYFRCGNDSDHSPNCNYEATTRWVPHNKNCRCVIKLWLQQTINFITLFSKFYCLLWEFEMFVAIKLSKQKKHEMLKVKF